MESNIHHEDSVTSSEEVDQPEQESLNVGTGRSYECVFCKRGFTTAQALGGHMNIHRKDRAKNRASNSVNSTKQEENYAGPRFYQPISSFSPPYREAHEAQIHYRTYFPASTSSILRPFFETKHGGNSIGEEDWRMGNSIGEEDWRMSLSLQFGPNHVEKKRKGGIEDDGLDLELRLGHDP